MEISFGRALWRNFLGQSPDWYKLILLVFLVVNPIIFSVNPFIAGWLLVAEFIFTLAMALKCYPLLPGGLLAFEAVVIGMTSAEHVKAELASNLEVLLLLIFMVAGIYFMKQLLLFIFTRLLLSIPSKMFLSLAFCLAAAFLSAFLDALTVVAVVISVAVGFYGIYHRVASSRPNEDLQDDSHVEAHNRDVLEQFRAFLRSLMMHAGVGTALGGVMTMVGEPQNLIIAKAAGWHFGDFFLRMAPVSVPVLICGLATCLLVEKFRLFGYGAQLPEPVRQELHKFDVQSRSQRTRQETLRLIAQDHWRLAYRGAGVPSCRSGADWPVSHYSRHHLYRRDGRTCHRQGVYRSPAVYRPVGGVLCRRGGDYRPAPVRADYCLCIKGVTGCSALAVLPV